MHFSTLLATGRVAEIVLAFLLNDGSTIHNASEQITFSLFTPNENWTHVLYELIYSK
jgi:hypothetical protein